MKKKWEYYETDETKVKEIAEQIQLPTLVANILVNRNITQKDKIEVFLNPNRNDFYSPYLLNDMEKAVNRIQKAIQKREKVVIYGDYDVDGITSITVLKRFLAEQQLQADYYVPDRLEEGYGLNKKAMEHLAQNGYQLMITVDCGITAMEEVDYATELGMETIVTDHHEPLDTIPKALAVVNPKRKDSTYPFQGLAGVGVVFKLIQAISEKIGLPEKAYLKYLDLVCIGTISDIVPLIDENRVITKLGLKLVAVTKNIGLRELIKSIKLKKMDSTSISFGVAPRMNACGRMGKADEAIELFLTENVAEAHEITEKLNRYNSNRQIIEKRIFQEAMDRIAKDHIDQENSIVLGGENWHHGVIGIVSSKITETFYKPSILICFDGEEGKGSGRSIMGFDLHKALCESSAYLDKFGGHEMAVGLSLQRKNFEPFKKKFQEIVEASNIQEMLPVIKIDADLDLKKISLQTVEELMQLEPFGEQNKVPIFGFKNLKIDAIRSLSDGKHLKLSLKYSNGWLDAIGFNMGELVEQYRIGDKVDVVGTLEINQFRDRKNLQVNLKDMRRSF